jgi:hypothetical protein
MRYQSVIPQEKIFSLHKFSELRRQFDIASNIRQAFAQATNAIMFLITARAMRSRRQIVEPRVKHNLNA